MMLPIGMCRNRYELGVVVLSNIPTVYNHPSFIYTNLIVQYLDACGRTAQSIAYKLSGSIKIR